MPDQGEPVEKTWDQRILEVIPSGIDDTQLVENLRRTPTERIERVQELINFMEEMRASLGDQLQKRSHGPGQ